ncbi:MAG: hypothetical protein IPP73_15035 [Chitinophagaceae bacterium]|nr:hypothetical protein [Chitinophagaceae bacterium]
MPDIFDLLLRWWKKILLVVILSVVAVGTILYLKPKLYLSTATSVPASSVAADKSKIFGDNIQGLYSNLGNSDDLDMIIGTASLDTVYLFLADSFSLKDHYKFEEENSLARIHSADKLKSRSQVFKSDYGELKVKVWDTDKNLAPQLANTIMAKLQQMQQDLQAAGNTSTLSALQKKLVALKLQKDSVQTGINQADKQQEIVTYEKLISQYQLLIENKPLALIPVEKARASLQPDKPRMLEDMVTAALLSLLFALVAALVLDRNK